MAGGGRKREGKTKLAVALVSGGLDSAVAAAIALRDCAEVAFLHISYGQRTWRRERSAFRALARHYHVRHPYEFELAHLSAIGGSCLTDHAVAVPEDALGSAEIPVSYVPFRNANLLSCAASLAEAITASAIYIGAVEADSSGYPDCRESFFRSFERAIQRGTRPQTRIEIITPLIRMTKERIVKTGVRLSVPLELTWSCYRGTRVACGRCDSCLLRLRGFERAGLKDPVPYSQGARSDAVRPKAT